MADAKTKTVPVEPTPEMIAAGWDCLRRAHLPRLGPGNGLVEAYRAMAAAAPQPAASDVPHDAVRAPDAWVGRNSWDKLHDGGTHIAIETLVHRVEPKSGTAVPLFVTPQPADVPRDAVRARARLAALEEAAADCDLLRSLALQVKETDCSREATAYQIAASGIRALAFATPAPSTSTEEALRAENARLREALEPFAESAEAFNRWANLQQRHGSAPDPEQIMRVSVVTENGEAVGELRVGDLRLALSALSR